MHRLNLGQEGDACALAPRQKLRRGAGVGAPGVRIADLRGEKLQEANAGAGARGRY